MKSLYALCVLLFLLAASVVYAQDDAPPIPIDFDQIVTGEITGEQPAIRYTFTAEQGDVVTIRMSATSEADSFERVDSFLFLQDANGNEITFDDDSGGMLNSLIVSPPLNAGDYIVVATRCCMGGGNSTGPFELEVRRVDVPSLTLNQPIIFELDGRTPAGFGFFASNQTSAEFVRARVEAVAGDGNFFAEARGPIGARYFGAWESDRVTVVEPVPMNITDGAYYFQVTLSGGRIGDMMMGTVEQVPTTFRMVIEEIEAQPVTLGETFSGTLDGTNRSDYYTFTANSGDLLRVTGATINGDSFEAIFYNIDGEIYSVVGNAYMQEADFVVDPVGVTRGGTQIIVVRRAPYDDRDPETDVVNYEMRIELAQTPVLEAGVATQGSIEPNQNDRVYLFNGEAGQTVTFTLSSLDDTYAPSMDVQRPFDDDMAMMGGGGGFLNVYSNESGSFSHTLTLPATGRYMLRVFNGKFGMDGPEPGRFEITVTVND